MMQHKKIAAALTLTASLLLSACGGGGNALPSAHASGPFTTYTGPKALADFQWGAPYLQDATYVGPASFGTMGVDVAVQMRDPDGLGRYAQMVSDSKSGFYRHFLTPQEIGQRFGATSQTYNDAAQYFAGHGLHVGGWTQHMSLMVAGTQANLEAAFGTTFGVYEKNGLRFIAPHSQPHFSRVVPVTSIGRLISAPRMKTYDIPVRGGNNTFVGYSPQQVQNAFDYSGAYSAGYDGTGINVGIIGSGVIAPKDVPTFGRVFNVRVATVTEPPVTDSGEAAGLSKAGIPTPNPNASASPQPPYAYSDFGLATPPPATLPCNQQSQYASVLPTANCNPEDGEAQLDTEQVASLAPGSNVEFYLGFNPTDCANHSCDGLLPGAIGVEGLFIADDEIQQAIADNTADVLSLSYGGGEHDNVGSAFDATGKGFQPMEFAALAAEGIAVFVSSGDSGAEECSSEPTTPCVSYPSGDVNVTSVGGITASLNTFGRATSEFTAWGQQTGGGQNGGSGGGASAIFPAPPWQAQNIPGTPATREQPDVSLLADPASNVILLENVIGTSSGQVGQVGGTSVAAPDMAAMWALVLQACKQSSSCATAGGTHPYRLGNAAPLLYAIYGGKYAGSTSNPASFVPHLGYAQAFFDVIYGDNALAQPGATPPPGKLNPPPVAGCCLAGPGYDMTTGIGVPFAGHLIQAVTGQTAP